MKGNMAFVNEFHLGLSILDKIKNQSSDIKTKELPIQDLSLHMKELLTKEETIALNNEIEQQSWIPVGIDGIKEHYKEGDLIGSYRLSCYEVSLAESLFQRIKPHLPKIREMNECSPTDWDGHKYWEPIGINPLFRFIKYTKNGLLIPHYDGPFIQDENVRSLSSLVIYLTDNSGEGGTRFLKDEQMNFPLHKRDYSDWTHEASDEFVELKIDPSMGDGLLFDHRVLHDSEKIKGDTTKTIIRTDILYRRV